MFKLLESLWLNLTFFVTIATGQSRFELTFTGPQTKFISAVVLKYFHNTIRNILIVSGTPKRSPILIGPCSSFFTVRMASGMVRGHVRTTDIRRMADDFAHGGHAPKYVDLILAFASLILDIHVLSIESC